MDKEVFVFKSQVQTDFSEKLNISTGVAAHKFQEYSNGVKTLCYTCKDKGDWNGYTS